GRYPQSIGARVHRLRACHREAINETVVGNQWLMSALRAHQIHYGNERTADCRHLCSRLSHFDRRETRGPRVAYGRHRIDAVEGRPEESEARDDFAPHSGDFRPTPL